MYTAAASWCGFPGFHGANDTRVGGYVLFLPDLRGRFGDIERDADTSEVEVVLDTPQADQWRVKGGYYDGDNWREFNVPATSPTTQVPCRGSYYELALVDEAGNIVDHWHAASRAATLRRVTRKAVQMPQLVEHVAQCLEKGECETVECKPAIQPGVGTEKFERVVATVVAFANTEGGTILFGVTDRLEPRDLLAAAEFKKWGAKTSASEDDQEALLQYGYAITDAVRRQLDKLPEITPATIEFKGAHVVMLRVAKGAELPYYDREGIFLVRRGSSVRPAHPDREPHLYLSVGRSS